MHCLSLCDDERSATPTKAKNCLYLFHYVQEVYVQRSTTCKAQEAITQKPRLILAPFGDNQYATFLLAHIAGRGDVAWKEGVGKERWFLVPVYSKVKNK